jgi:hypothetical protein
VFCRSPCGAAANAVCREVRSGAFLGAAVWISTVYGGVTQGVAPHNGEARLNAECDMAGS